MIAFTSDQIAAATNTAKQMVLSAAEATTEYEIIIRYGEGESNDKWVSYTTAQVGHTAECVIDASIEKLSTTPDEENDNLVHTFSISADVNKWCVDPKAIVTLGESKEGALKWSAPATGEAKQNVTVTQNSNFGNIDYNFNVTYTHAGSDATDSASGEFDFDIKEHSEYCIFVLKTDFTFVTDTLLKVDVHQNYTLDASALCGAANVKYNYLE